MKTSYREKKMYNVYEKRMSTESDDRLGSKDTQDLTKCLIKKYTKEPYIQNRNNSGKDLKRKYFYKLVFNDLDRELVALNEITSSLDQNKESLTSSAPDLNKKFFSEDYESENNHKPYINLSIHRNSEEEIEVFRALGSTQLKHSMSNVSLSSRINNIKGRNAILKRSYAIREKNKDRIKKYQMKEKNGVLDKEISLLNINCSNQNVFTPMKSKFTDLDEYYKQLISEGYIKNAFDNVEHTNKDNEMHDSFLNSSRFHTTENDFFPSKFGNSLWNKLDEQIKNSGANINEFISKKSFIQSNNIPKHDKIEQNNNNPTQWNYYNSIVDNKKNNAIKPTLNRKNIQIHKSKIDQESENIFLKNKVLFATESLKIVKTKLNDHNVELSSMIRKNHDLLQLINNCLESVEQENYR